MSVSSRVADTDATVEGTVTVHDRRDFCDLEFRRRSLLETLEKWPFVGREQAGGRRLGLGHRFCEQVGELHEVCAKLRDGNKILVDGQYGVVSHRRCKACEGDGLSLTIRAGGEQGQAIDRQGGD